MSAMEPARWRRVAELFDAALDIPAGEREAWIDARCAGDSSLGAALRRLLAADSGAGEHEFLESPAVAVRAWDAEAAATAPQRFGPYRLLRLIGEGGMGEVHLAERVDGAFEQRVALKLLPHPTPGLLQRFRRERQILARLQHPNIARLLDGGVGDNGVPYFAMEFVDGAAITHYVAAGGLDQAATLRLFLQICDGVQYAHRNLVVHRDLKPSNILITTDGVAKLLDFGIAKVLEDSTPGDATRTQARMYTRAYAAPEQIGGGTVTTATDVYALGVVLHELLTGRRPLDGAPKHPTSAAPDSDAAHAGADSGLQRRRVLRGDVDRLVAKACAPEPERRYASVEALAADIRNYLDGRPIAARGDSAGYRLRKFVRRNRVGVAAAAVAIVALVGALAVSLWQRGIAQQQAQRAETKSRTAEAVKDYLLSVFASANPYNTEGKIVSARDLLESGFSRIDDKLRDQPAVAAELNAAFVDTFFQLDQPDLAERAAEKAIADYRQSLPDGAIEILGVESTVAEVRLFRAQTDGLVDRLDGMLARIGDRGGDYADLRGTVLTLLGLAHFELGDYERAAAVGAQAAAQIESLHGHDSYDVAVALYDVALARLRQGRFGAAAALIDDFVAVDRRLVGPEHPGLITDVSTIAMLLQNLGRLREARDLLQATAAARQRLFGATHRSLVKNDARLASVLIDLGQAQQAESLLADVIARAGKVSMATLDRSEMHLDHARALLALDRFDAARAEFEAAQAPIRASAANDSPLSLAIGAALADIERREGNGARARAQLDPIVERQRRRDDLTLPESLLVAARIDRAEGQADRARQTLDEAAAILKRQGRPLHSLALDIALEQAALASAGGDAVTAAAHLRQAATVGCVNLGCDDARVAHWLHAAASTAASATAAVDKPGEKQYAVALDILAKAAAARKAQAPAAP